MMRFPVFLLILYLKSNFYFCVSVIKYFLYLLCMELYRRAIPRESGSFSFVFVNF